MKTLEKVPTYNYNQIREMLVRIYIQQFLYNYISLWNLYSTKLLEYIGYVVISFLIELRMYEIYRNLIANRYPICT